MRDGAGVQVGADTGRVGEREVGLDTEAEPNRGRHQVAERRVAAVAGGALEHVRRVSGEDVEVGDDVELAPIGLEHLRDDRILGERVVDGDGLVLRGQDLELVLRIVVGAGGGDVLALIREHEVEPTDVFAERARVHDEDAARLARALLHVRVEDRIGVELVVRRRAVAVDGVVGVGDPDVSGAQRIRRAVGDLLRRVQDDVVVATEHHVDARGPTHHALVHLEAKVGDHHDEVDVRAEQIDVELRGLDRVERLDSGLVRLIEDRREARQVAHADGGHLEAGHVEDLERLGEGRELGALRQRRVVELVVRRQGSEPAPALELGGHVERTAVELVVADDGGVGAERRERADLGLTRVEVEDRRALEDVARVEVEGAPGARALAAEDVRHARDATDVLHRIEGAEARGRRRSW
ncbi:MAG: hypothetical protein U0235_19740 [Polyangiaceae bacterium]